MKKQRKMLVSLILALAVIWSVIPGAAATETEHEHEWTVNATTPQVHELFCIVCGEHQDMEHTFDDSNVCTFCGYVYDVHVHDWQCTRADGYWHTMSCSGCGEAQTTNHTFDSANCCTVCGYIEHEHTWQYIVKVNDYTHSLGCTQCDSVTTEDHIYGSDGKCTVCGASPPHEHDWKWNGDYYGGSHHILGCTCEKTMLEEHLWEWDGVTQDPQAHMIVCTVCDESMLTYHKYRQTYYDGTICVVCGYSKETHIWEYNRNYNEEEHEMICFRCHGVKWEKHDADGNGDCVVCGYHVYDVTEPEETEPEETEPVETEPEETDPEVTEPEVTEPKETEPVETEPEETEPEVTEPQETKPEETKPEETKPEETEPAPTETTPEPPAEPKPQNGNLVWVWAAVIALSGLGVVLLILIKKLT